MRGFEVPSFLFVLLQNCRSRFPASQMSDQTAQDHRAAPRAVPALSPGTRKLSCQAECDSGSLGMECKCETNLPLLCTEAIDEGHSMPFNFHGKHKWSYKVGFLI